MSRIAYVNGRYLPHAPQAFPSTTAPSCSATASTRSARCAQARRSTAARHLARLARSLAALRIAAPLGEAALKRVMREVIARNRVRDGTGLSADLPRARAARPRLPRRCAAEPRGDGQIARPAAQRSPRAERRENRHTSRRTLGAPAHQDPATLAERAGQAERAREAGAYETWFVDADGFVTDGRLDQRLDRRRSRAPRDPPGRRTRFWPA